MNRHDQGALVLVMLAALIAALCHGVLGQSRADPEAENYASPADFDRDGDVDLADHARFQAEFTGPIPPWLQAKIAWYLQAPPMNPPIEFYRYRYFGEIVFWRGGYCCDFPSVLWNAYGNFLCCPGGGLDGTGDERCPDFRDYATDEVLVWADDR